MRTLMTFIAALGMMGTFGLARAQEPPQRMSAVPTISASGSATESRAPDQAEVSVGVVATGKTSEEAQDALNRQMERVIAAVKEAKLAGLVTQTQGLSLQPEYERVDRGTSRPPKIVGYRASNSVVAKTSEVAKVGKIVDAAVASGSNQIWGISFTLKNDAEARRDAIRRAATDAKAKAQAIADALGVQLGRVMQANTGGVQARPYRYQMKSASMEGADFAGAAPTPVEAGQVEVSADVTVEFAIVDPERIEPGRKP